jgi:hypothetical protein
MLAQHHQWIGLAISFGTSMLVIVAGLIVAMSGYKYVDPWQRPKAKRVTTPL